MNYNILDFASNNVTALVIGIISANLVGVIGYLIWLCLQKVAAKFCVERGMSFLKGIVASFFATFCLTCILWIVYRLRTDRKAFFGGNMWLTRPMVNVLLVVILLWLVSVISIMIYRYTTYWKIRYLCFSNMPVLDGDIIKMADRWKEKLNINKKVTLFYNDEISSPALLYYNGYQILLPTYELSKAELDVVLLHELMHLKNNDIHTKNIAYIVNAFFAYNPVTYLLRKQLVEWGEVNCDLCCCELREEMDWKDYYRCIMELKERGRDISQPDVIACLFEKQNMLDFRIDALASVQGGGRKHKGLYYAVTTMAALVLMVFSVGLVSYGFSYCYDKTVVSIQEEYHEEELDSTFREGSKEQLLAGAEISYWDENILYNVENLECKHSTDFSLEPNEVKVFTLPEQVDGDLVIDVTFEGESYQVGFLGDGDRIKYMDKTTTLIIKVPEKDRESRQVFIRNTGEDTCKIELFLTEHPFVKSK